MSQTSRLLTTSKKDKIVKDSTSNDKTNSDNIRSLETDHHCFNESESIITESTMLLTYIFVVLCISSLLTTSVIGANHKYSVITISTFIISGIFASVTFYIYKLYDNRILQNFISDYVIFDKEKNLFQIYVSKTEICCCGCFSLKNDSKLLWECSISSLQKCKYFKLTRVMVIYYYNKQSKNNEKIKFSKLYFVNKKWEMKINSTLNQCKSDWDIKTQTS
eukprot:286683_1